LHEERVALSLVEEPDVFSQINHSGLGVHDGAAKFADQQNAEGVFGVHWDAPDRLTAPVDVIPRNWQSNGSTSRGDSPSGVSWSKVSCQQVFCDGFGHDNVDQRDWLSAVFTAPTTDQDFS
jgi:hypothetical protein